MAGGSYLGLDIGSDLIKVAEMRSSGGRLEVVALGVDATPKEAFNNGVIEDVQLLGQAVRNLIKKSGIGTNQVISCASSNSAVVVRVIEVPQMNPAELAETMKWETERQVPFAMSDIVMDYKPIERPEGYADGANMEVVLAVAQQEFIDRHVEVLFAAGLKPKSIDVAPLAAGRALLELGGNGSHAAGHTVGVINIGASNTDIGIFRDRLLTFPRTLPLAGDNFTRAISDTLQVDLTTAETYKRDLAEVMFDQMPQQNAGFDQSFTQEGGGFIDFAAPPPVSGPTSSPSGRMPFDFTAPGDTPDLSSAQGPAPVPPPLDPGFGVPPPVETPDYGIPPVPEGLQGFYSPEAPAHTPNLPAIVSSGDPAKDALRIQVFNAIAPLLAEMVQEIRRSLDYYRSKTGDAPVHEMLLVGGTAKLKNLARFIESELGIPTRVANPLEHLQVTSKNYSREYLEEIATLFPVCLGLAASEFVAPAPSSGKKKK